MIKQQLDLSPKPTDGIWSPTKCYYAIGERVTFNFSVRLDEKPHAQGEIVGYKRNQYKRISYVIKLDEPIEGSDEWNAITEHIQGGPWHAADPLHSHNVEFNNITSDMCGINRTCVIHRPAHVARSGYPSCNVCGGEQVEIRGRYPTDAKRVVCPTCLAERLDQIQDVASTHYGQPASTGRGDADVTP